MKFTIRIVQIGFTAVMVLLVLVVAIYCVWAFAPRGVLPSNYRTVKMSPAELEALVLKIIPIGTPKKDAEKALNHQFRCNWHETPNGQPSLSNMGFKEAIDRGDVIYAELGVFGLPLPDVASINLLFDVTTGNLMAAKASISSETL